MLTRANRSVKTMKQPYANRSIELFPDWLLMVHTDHMVNAAKSKLAKIRYDYTPAMKRAAR
jgi:hypothetical protein